MERLRHLNKASHNEEFFNSFDIDKTKFRDWIITGIFYAIHHYYDAYFAMANKHSESHDILDDWICNDNRITNTYGDYRELKQYRWKSSYWFKNFSPQEIKTIILPKFENIKKQISIYSHK